MHLYEGYNDEQLIQLLKFNNEEAFNMLFARYNKRLVAEAYLRLQDNEEANDMVQEVLCAIWTKRSELDVVTNLKAYLLQAVRNKCYDLIRSKTRYRSKKKAYTIIAGTYTDAVPIEVKELGKQLEFAINQISPSCRQAFEQLYIHQKSLKEIATQMDINVQSVKNHIHKALKLLRKNLKHSLS